MTKEVFSGLVMTSIHADSSVNKDWFRLDTQSRAKEESQYRSQISELFSHKDLKPRAYNLWFIYNVISIKAIFSGQRTL